MSLFTQETPQLGLGTTVGGYKVQYLEPVNLMVSATSTSQSVFIVPNLYVAGGTAVSPSYKLVEVNVVFGTAGGAAAAVTVEHLTGTQASGAGTALLSATIPLTGAANTVLSGVNSTTLTAAQATFAPGDRLGVVLSGTLTGLANCYIQVLLAIA